MRTAVPYPPLELASRVGSLAGQPDPFGLYDVVGRESRDSIVSLLPAQWTWEGAHVLDFGCGAGRTARHFLSEAEIATFWACDIDRKSVQWVEANLSPPVRPFVNNETPPLPLDAGSLDLVYAVSVFTHLTAAWSSWLLELHRLLKDGGVLIATFIGPAAARHVTDEPWDPNRIGMNVLKPGQSWELGGPMVLHSPWWIEAHWGRAFDILDLWTDGFGLPPPEGQGVVSMRKRLVELEPADLERPAENEPREAISAGNNVLQLTTELVDLRAEYDRLLAAWHAERGRREQVEHEAAHLCARLNSIATSRSWRLTRPLRSVAGIVRAFRP